MNEQAFGQMLTELINVFGTAGGNGKSAGPGAATKTRSPQADVRNAVAGLTDSIDYLRLSIKYLVFDLEATRRENAYLRKMLEEQSGE